MKECELCEMPARMYCESDQASLCWRCDSKVHSANFLVARHSRSLLCQVCQSPTPWKASGGKLGPTVSICERCVGDCDGIVHQDDEASEGGNEDELEILDDDDEEEIEEEEEENQVVPLAFSTPPPPPSSSCSSKESSSSGGGDEDDDEIDRALSLKRLRRGNVDQDDIGSSSSQKNFVTMVETAREARSLSSSSRPSKQQKRQVQKTRSELESAAIIASLNELQKRLIGKNSVSENEVLLWKRVWERPKERYVAEDGSASFA